MGPENFRIGAANIAFGGEDLGLTNEDGAIVHVEPTFYEHKSAKYGETPLRISVTGYNITIEMTLAEPTLDNIEKVFAGVTRSGDTINVGGVAGREATADDLVITPVDGDNVFTFHKVAPFSVVDLAYKGTEPRLLKITFKALADVAQADASNIGTVAPASES